MSEEYVPLEDEVKFENGKWYQAVKDGDKMKWVQISITDVWPELLLLEWENLVHELSDKERDLHNLKEEYLHREQEIVATTDFKEIYGANNQKVRDRHVKETLSEMVEAKTNLQFSIDFIRNYIPLIKEVIRTKNNGH